MSHTPAALSASRRAPRRSALAALLALALLLSVAGIPGTSVAGGTPAASSAVLDGSALSADRTSRADGAALPQLDPGLEGIVGLAGAADESGARTLAEALDVEYEDGRVTVVLEVEAGQHERVRAALGSVHAEETGAYEDLIRAEVPVGSLRALARAEGVRVVRPPMRPQIASGDAAAQVGRPDRGPVTVSKDGETLEVPSGLRPASLQAPAGRPATDPDIEAQSITYFSHGFEAWPGPWAVWSEGGGPGWGRTTYRSSEGSYSAYCAGSSIAPPGPYANNMHSWMWTATPVNLSTATRAYLVFDVWTDLEAGWDDLFVGVSFDDEDYEGYNMYANSGGWTTVVYDLSDIYRDGSISYVGRPQVYIAAVFTSDASIVKEGGYIDNIRIVDTPPSLMSQGVSETNATALHAEGIDGSGTKVGVIDVGFWGYEYLLGTELPDAVQTWGGGSLGPEGTGIFEEHGTAVAEVVYDMAPGAELYLAQIADEIDFGNAAAWMTANGVDAVNASLGWFEGPRDGTDTLNDVVSATVAGDAFWAQAAGNSREEHWSGDWTALNGYLQWSSGTNIQRFEGSAGSAAVAHLMWDDDWEAPTQDYDLYLFREDSPGFWVEVARSDYPQTGLPGQTPSEVIAYTLPVDGTYAWAVELFSATRTDVDFDFFDRVRPLEHVNTARSFLIPSDNDSWGFMAAGAIGRGPAFAQEPYSSEGPTRDGRLTPHIAMPSSVTNVVYGVFAGTSAAAPHLAGAAALVKQEYPGYSAGEIEDHLTGLTIDLGAPGPDPVYGHGRLLFDGEAPPPPVDVANIAGAGRYETAVEASRFGWAGGSEVVVLATGRNWPDALGGATLAGLFDAPILLTARDSLPAVTLAEMGRLGAEWVVILGGPAAVSQTVENQLIASFGNDRVLRVGGGNRYETAWDIAWVATEVHDGWDGTAFIATATNYPDALAAGSIAAAHGYPIFLASPRGLGDTGWVMDFLDVQKVVILGGTTAVSSATENELRQLFGNANVTRRSGGTRYATAVDIAEWGVSQKGMSFATPAIATGQNYPDALTGGALQGRHGSVMLLTRGTALSPEPAALLAREKAGIQQIRFLGGVSSLDMSVRNAVIDIFR